MILLSKLCVWRVFCANRLFKNGPRTILSWCFAFIVLIFFFIFSLNFLVALPGTLFALFSQIKIHPTVIVLVVMSISYDVRKLFRGVEGLLVLGSCPYIFERRTAL